MIDKAAEMSTSGLALSRYSATSWDKNSYETVLRPRGNISKSPRRIRMLPGGVVSRGIQWRIIRMITDGYK